MKVAKMVEESQSHKGSKITSYDAKFKLEAISHAETASKQPASKTFNVAANRIREWRKQKPDLLSLKEKSNGAKRRRLDGAGRKPLNEQLEESLMEWIYQRREKCLRVSQKLIMKVALILYQELVKEDETTGVNENVSFVASTGCLQKFMRRNGHSLR